MATSNDISVSQQRRSSSRSIKRKKFDDEWIESSLTNKIRKTPSTPAVSSAPSTSSVVNSDSTSLGEKSSSDTNNTTPSEQPLVINTPVINENSKEPRPTAARRKSQSRKEQSRKESLPTQSTEDTQKPSSPQPLLPPPSLPPPAQNDPSSPPPDSLSSTVTQPSTLPPPASSPAPVLEVPTANRASAGRKRTRRRRTNVSHTHERQSERLSEKRAEQANPPPQFSATDSSVDHDLFHLRNPRYIRWLHELDNFREWMNCLCGLKEKTGLIVQCECCLTWQHVACLGLESDKDLPEVFVCSMCKNPRGLRESCRYMYDFSWLKSGILPTFPGSDGEEEDMQNLKNLRKEKVLTVNVLLDAALEVVSVIHALHYKLRLLDRREADLSLWKDSWLQREAKNSPPTVEESKNEGDPPVSISCNDFAGLKNSGIGDILDFSKDILEAAPMEQDKNDVPDDLRNELQEGTDLIDFIASSYDDMNGIKGNGSLNIDTLENNSHNNANLKPSELQVEDSNSLFPDDFTQPSSLNEPLKSDLTNGINHCDQNNVTDQVKEEMFPFAPEPGQALEGNFPPSQMDIQSTAPPMLIKEEAPSSKLEESFPNDQICDTSNVNIEASIKEEKPNLEEDSHKLMVPEALESDRQTSDILAQISKSASETDETTQEAEFNSCSRTNSQTSITDKCRLTIFESDEPGAMCRQNLREHLLDLHERLTKRLDFLSQKTSELEQDYGLNPDPAHVEKDAATFHDLIKELYKDLDIVYKISQCAW